jgi:hypothetical protein
MNEWLEAAKGLAKNLLRFAAGYAFCFYVGHFTEVQSLIIAFIALCALEGNRLAFKIAAKHPQNFEPYWISIEPQWYEICHDFGLAVGEKWTDLQEKCKSSSGEYNVLQNGVNLTALSHTLFYSNDHKRFFTGLDFNISIEELRPQAGNRFSFAPQFYVKQTVAGEKKSRVPVIEFGLVTQESIKETFHPADRRANIPIAQLPEIVFYAYAHAEDDYSIDKMEKVEKRTDKLLAQFGWTKGERDPDDSWLHWPLEIKHKYVHVSYRDLS